MPKAFARFRLGTEEDIADLQRIDLAASRLFEPTGLIDEGPDGPTPIPEAALRNGIAKKLLIVSLSDDTRFPNGFALMSRHSPDLYLDQISVDPAHGRRGIGANLLGLVIARADALKLRGVVLSTFRDLAWNGPFYARHGFVELAREDIATVGRLLTHLAGLEANTLLFCDDLSFDYDDAAYKSLKTVLDGGLAGRPQNVLFYATSNRRHLLPRDMMENEQRAAIHSSEAIDEKVSLSDRFGLWLGFHRCDQDTFLAMVRGYIDHAGVSADADQIRAEAIEWAATRGGRSGRVAWQFAQDFIGRHL